MGSGRVPPSQGWRGNRRLVLSQAGSFTSIPLCLVKPIHRALMVDSQQCVCARVHVSVHVFVCVHSERGAFPLSWVWGGSLMSQPGSQANSAGRALRRLGTQHLSRDVLGQQLKFWLCLGHLSDGGPAGYGYKWNFPITVLSQCHFMEG